MATGAATGGATGAIRRAPAALLVAALLVVPALGVAYLQPRLAHTVHEVKQRDDVYVLPPPAELRAMTLGYHAAAVDLRPRAERAHGAELHVVATLVLARHEPLDRDAVLERLLELARHVAATAGDTFQHDRAGARAVVDDRRFELVAHLDRDLAGLRVTELGDVDGGLRLAADRDERGRCADGDHAAADDVAGLDRLLAALRLLLAGGEEGREVLVVVGGNHWYTYRPRRSADATPRKRPPLHELNADTTPEA